MWQAKANTTSFTVCFSGLDKDQLMLTFWPFFFSYISSWNTIIMVGAPSWTMRIMAHPRDVGQRERVWVTENSIEESLLACLDNSRFIHKRQINSYIIEAIITMDCTSIIAKSNFNTHNKSNHIILNFKWYSLYKF